MTERLNKHLFDVYGGVSDKRYKQLAFGRAIAVHQHKDDGRINQSIHALIWVTVQHNDEIQIVFSGNVPSSPQVDALRGQVERATVNVTTLGLLQQLAGEVRKAPVPADNESIYYARREVAEDLERLARHLASYLALP